MMVIRTDTKNVVKLKESIENLFKKNNMNPCYRWIDDIIFDHFFADDSLMVHRTDSADIIATSIFSSLEANSVFYMEEDDLEKEITKYIDLLVQEISSEYDKSSVQTDLSNSTEIVLNDGTAVPINQHLNKKYKS